MSTKDIEQEDKNERVRDTLKTMLTKLRKDLLATRSLNGLERLEHNHNLAFETFVIENDLEDNEKHTQDFRTKMKEHIDVKRAALIPVRFSPDGTKMTLEDITKNDENKASRMKSDALYKNITTRLRDITGDRYYDQMKDIENALENVMSRNDREIKPVHIARITEAIKNRKKELVEEHFIERICDRLRNHGPQCLDVADLKDLLGTARGKRKSPTIEIFVCAKSSLTYLKEHFSSVPKSASDLEVLLRQKALTTIKEALNDFNVTNMVTKLQKNEAEILKFFDSKEQRFWENFLKKHANDKTNGTIEGDDEDEDEDEDEFSLTAFKNCLRPPAYNVETLTQIFGTMKEFMKTSRAGKVNIGESRMHTRLEDFGKRILDTKFLTGWKAFFKKESVRGTVEAGRIGLWALAGTLFKGTVGSGLSLGTLGTVGAGAATVATGLVSTSALTVYGIMFAMSRSNYFGELVKNTVHEQGLKNEMAETIAFAKTAVSERDNTIANKIRKLTKRIRDDAVGSHNEALSNDEIDKIITLPTRRR
jgi:hypothetical protein